MKGKDKITKFLLKICLSTCIVSLQGALTFAVSLSPTAITISQPVHFLTPDGTDVILTPGDYEMNAAGNTLRLQSAAMKDPIHIQAGPAPYPDAVDFPLAMAIPIPDEGIYLALAVPKEAGLEAMGSYSGIHTRGGNLLQSRKTLSQHQRSRLKTFAGKLRKNPNDSELSNQWKELTKDVNGQSLSVSTKDSNALIQYVLRQSYLETTKDLQSYASKVNAINEQKKQLREELAKIRQKMAQTSDSQEKTDLEKLKEKTEQQLQDFEDQARKHNFEIQRLMSRYNQALQAAAALLKKKQESDSQAVRKIIN